MMQGPPKQNRVSQAILIIAMIPIAWLGMMLVHEFGHVLGAMATGGHVQRVVWHPLAISRTDVSPNHSPLLVTWAGPIVGVVVPLLLSAILSLARFRFAHLFAFFAGFCLLANGIYIGIGVFDPVGDARDMLRLGSPRWTLAAFGVPSVAAGLFIWHRVSGRFGFGSEPERIDSRVARWVAGLSIIMIVIAFIVGDDGS